MNQTSQIAIQASGTSEGAEKGWDERGRGRGSTKTKFYAFLIRHGNPGHRIVERDLTKDYAKYRLKNSRDSERRNRQSALKRTGVAKYKIIEHAPEEKDSEITNRADAKWGRFY